MGLKHIAEKEKCETDVYARRQDKTENEMSVPPVIHGNSIEKFCVTNTVTLFNCDLQ